jgi:hypothetical protein
MQTRFVRWIAVLSVLLFAGIGCGPPPGDTMESLYLVKIPANVKVMKYRAETFGMDPSFAWMLQPIDDAFLAELVRKNKLVKGTPDKMPSPEVYRWPSWWDVPHLKKLTEAYSNEESGLRHVFVDRKNNRIYMEFLGT